MSTAPHDFMICYSKHQRVEGMPASEVARKLTAALNAHGRTALMHDGPRTNIFHNVAKDQELLTSSTKHKVFLYFDDPDPNSWFHKELTDTIKGPTDNAHWVLRNDKYHQSIPYFDGLPNFRVLVPFYRNCKAHLNQIITDEADKICAALWPVPEIRVFLAVPKRSDIAHLPQCYGDKSTDWKPALWPCSDTTSRGNSALPWYMPASDKSPPNSMPIGELLRTWLGKSDKLRNKCSVLPCELPAADDLPGNYDATGTDLLIVDELAMLPGKHGRSLREWVDSHIGRHPSAIPFVFVMHPGLATKLRNTVNRRTKDFASVHTEVGILELDRLRKSMQSRSDNQLDAEIVVLVSCMSGLRRWFLRSVAKALAQKDEESPNRVVRDRIIQNSGKQDGGSMPSFP